MKKRHLIANVTVLAAGLGLATTDAHAIDTKIYPGIMCHATPGTQGVLSEFAGSIDNLSSSAELVVSCPLIRDASSINAALMQVFDRHPSVQFACTIFYEFASGSGLFAFSNEQKTPVGFFGSNVTQLSFPSIGGGQYYRASCSIPRTSGPDVSHLVSFAIHEND